MACIIAAASDLHSVSLIKSVYVPPINLVPSVRAQVLKIDVEGFEQKVSPATSTLGL
jgi:hypothetical protein